MLINVARRDSAMQTMHPMKTLPLSPVASEPTATSAVVATATTTAQTTAASRTASARSVSAYVSGSKLAKTAFIVSLLFATVFHRSVSALASVFEALFGAVDVGGEELIPKTGPFTLAVNHFHGAWTPFVTAAVLAALKRQRPDAVDDLAMVLGQRADSGKKRFFVARGIRAMVQGVLRRWERNLLRIPLGNSNVEINTLRTWRRVAQERPTLVFPEGLASITFEKVRPGAGQFLRALNVPIVPCAVWYHRGRWHVEFDAPILWATNPELSDLQVGLAIAQLLPADLTPHWRGVLERWNHAHDALAE
ncbi:MAG: hypothetical protein IT343_21895 [Candidatus Melainabacteria bacterium]|nr:hypothetical protein [Candidatus Melainabacteria bacterium]